MYFRMKNTLKNNRNHTLKQLKFDKIFLFLASRKKKRAKKKPKNELPNGLSLYFQSN